VRCKSYGEVASICFNQLQGLWISKAKEREVNICLDGIDESNLFIRKINLFKKYTISVYNLY
jgi:hypothetical protein